MKPCKEERSYVPIPVIRQVDQTVVQGNYLQIKQDIKGTINMEMKRIIDDPALATIITKK